MFHGPVGGDDCVGGALPAEQVGLDPRGRVVEGEVGHPQLRGGHAEHLLVGEVGRVPLEPGVVPFVQEPTSHGEGLKGEEQFYNTTVKKGEQCYVYAWESC